MLQQLAPEPLIVPFPTLRRAADADEIPFDPAELITLRAWYERCVLPEIEHEQSRRSLQSDRCALNQWEKCTLNRDIRGVSRDDLIMFRDALIDRGCRPGAINAYWRELKAIFKDAVYRGLIKRTPDLNRRHTQRLIKEPPKMQRETITLDELAALHRACRKATYPQHAQYPAPLLWRRALLLLWMYGPRPGDVFTLLWSAVRWSERLLRFEAHKTGKLQGMHLTPLVVESLRTIQGHSERIFPRFNARGCFLRKPGLWKPGIYTTWRTEILPDSGISTPITFKHFRESAVTFYNGQEPGLGGWIAGHHMPGVTAQHYDLPTLRIRECIERRPVPACFEELD